MSTPVPLFVRATQTVERVPVAASVVSCDGAFGPHYLLPYQVPLLHGQVNARAV